MPQVSIEVCMISCIHSLLVAWPWWSSLSLVMSMRQSNYLRIHCIRAIIRYHSEIMSHSLLKSDFMKHQDNKMSKSIVILSAAGDSCGPVFPKTPN